MPRFISPITDIKANGSVSFFDSNTNAPKITYKDELETIQNLLTIPVDANGNLPNIFFSGSASVIYLDEFGQQYAARNPVGEEIGLGNFTSWSNVVTYDAYDIVRGSDNHFYLSLSSSNQNNDPTTSPADWEQIRFIGVWNTNITYAIGDVVQTTDGNLWKALTATSGNDPSVDEGDNWIAATTNAWINKTAPFSIIANKRYQIDASGGAVDAALDTSYIAGDAIIVHNESISTSTVRLINTALTIRGPNGDITSSDNLVLEPGDTAQIAMKTTTIGELV